jgi:hypothetical protein
MKRTIWLVIASFALIIGSMMAQSTSATTQAGPSLGDYARKARQNKPQSNSASRHYDNDNLPTGQQLSVVGPEATAPATTPNGQGTPAAAAVADQKQAQEDRQQANVELQGKIKDQQAKIDALTHELNLDQREYRLRAAAFYGDAGARLRDSAQWDKDDAQYKSEMDSKQQKIDAAKQQLEELQEQARKAGIVQKEKDQGGEKDKPADEDKK